MSAHPDKPDIFLQVMIRLFRLFSSLCALLDLRCASPRFAFSFLLASVANKQSKFIHLWESN